ncbi:MAG: zinc-finger domain-containing protein [Micavibrio sp.]|nr:zinc-finger domain-containing protein [Micavibrio sp.]
MTTKHPEILLVSQSTHQVWCNGGGALGHPKVYYTFDGADSVTCGYCDRLFTKQNQLGAKPWKTAKGAA